MRSTLDLDLHDAELGAEIHLVAELMVAAAESPRRLSRDAIDALLGLSRGAG